MPGSPVFFTPSPYMVFQSSAIEMAVHVEGGDAVCRWRIRLLTGSAVFQFTIRSLAHDTGGVQSVILLSSIASLTKMQYYMQYYM